MTAVDTARVRSAIDPQGGILLALQTIQEMYGFLPSGTREIVADLLNVSKAEVHGVITYYTDLRETPPSRVMVRVCTAESCQALGAHDVVALMHREGFNLHTGVEVGGVSAEQVFCLGNCVLGPCATVDGQLRARITGESLLTEARERAL